MRPEPAARHGGSSGAGLGGERGAQALDTWTPGVSPVAASVPQNRGELWGWDILGPVRGECSRKRVAAVGGDNRGPWIGQHMEGMWPCARGNGSEETPGVSLMRHLQPIDGRDRHMVGSTKWFLVLCLRRNKGMNR